MPAINPGGFVKPSVYILARDNFFKISEMLLTHIVVCNHFDMASEPFIDCWFETFCNTESKVSSVIGA